MSTIEAIRGDGFMPLYNVPPDDLNRLSIELLTKQPPTVDDQYVCYRFDGTEEFSNLGRHIEGQVFEEAFANDSQKMAELYGPYEAASTLFVVMDRLNIQPVGAIRTIRNSPAGIPTLAVAEEELGIVCDVALNHHAITDIEKVWDVGTLAVPEEYRERDSHLISNILYRAMHIRALHEGIDHYVSIIDSDVRGTFDFLGIPFVPIAASGSFEFEGSTDSQAMYGDATDFVAGVARTFETADPEMKGWLAPYSGRLALGEGIDHRLMFNFS